MTFFAVLPICSPLVVPQEDLVVPRLLAGLAVMGWRGSVFKVGVRAGQASEGTPP